MIIAKIDEDAFLETVRHSPTIAFQKLEYGYAVAASLVAFYAPTKHPGGGNIDEFFVERLAYAFLSRMSLPHLRTLRPTTKPIPTVALISYLRAAFFGGPEPMSEYCKARGDHPAVIDFECQEVILAIEEHERPDLKQAMIPGKRDALSDALDLVIDHATVAREFAEVGDYKPESIRLHILQASRAMQTTLEFLLR